MMPGKTSSECEVAHKHGASVATTGPVNALRAKIEADIDREDAAADRADWFRRYRNACKPTVDEEFLDEPLPDTRPFELNYYADQGLIEGPEVGEEISDEDRRWAFSAEGEYLALAKQRTGETLPDAKLVEIRRDHAKLLEQSHAIAERMEKAGFVCYRNTPFGLFRYYVHSRHVEKIPAFRRVTFIPYVSQSLRGPMLSALEAFLDSQPFARMWTMTSGPRVPLAGIRERAQWLHGRLSDLNAQPFMKEAGVEIVFRSTELGTPETDANGNPVNGGEIETDESGQMWFHVHAHCVVIQKKGFIPPKKWSAFLKQVGAFWVHWWKDGSETASGRIVDAREVCKYVTKPGEMLKLDGAQLVALQAQLSRLKLVQPMGMLAAQIKARAEKQLRLVRERTPDGPVFREVKNWNRHTRQTKAEKAQAAAEKLGGCKKVNADSFRLLSRLMPGYGPCGIAQPRVMVMATAWTPAAEQQLRKDSRVDRLIRATWEEYAAGRAIRVHTCTSTVGETSAFPFVAHLPPAKIPLTGAELAGFTR